MHVNVHYIKQVNPMLYLCSHREGFEANEIEAVLHQVELARRHQPSRFGLNLGVVSRKLKNFYASPIYVKLAIFLIYVNVYKIRRLLTQQFNLLISKLNYMSIYFRTTLERSIIDVLYIYI